MNFQTLIKWSANEWAALQAAANGKPLQNLIRAALADYEPLKSRGDPSEQAMVRAMQGAGPARGGCAEVGRRTLL